METGIEIGYLVLKDGKKHYISVPVDLLPTLGSTKFLTSGVIFSELAKKLSKVEVTDLDDLSAITESGLYELCLNTSGTHTEEYEYFLMLVERSLPFVTFTLMTATGYKQRTYNHSASAWSGSGWSEHIYALEEHGNVIGAGAAWVEVTRENDDSGKIELTVQDSNGDNHTVYITPSNIANLARVLSDPDKEEVTDLGSLLGTIDVTELTSGHIYSFVNSVGGRAVKNCFSNVDEFTNDKGEDVCTNVVFRYIKVPYSFLSQTTYTHIVDIICAWGDSGSQEPM